MEDNFSMAGGGGMVQAVMRAVGSDAERQMKLRSMLLTFCCAARVLTGRGPVLGVGDP